MTVLVECQSLTKSFGSVQALNGLSLSIDSGPAVGLVGPNGAGKTTFFSLLSDFLKASSGTIQILGHQPNAAALKGHIGVLPQDAPFMKGISVKAQLTLFARLQRFNRQAATNEAMRVLELVNMAKYAKQFPETLSYGQRKKVSIAQALIGQPELIMLDEPTSGLDPVAANEVRSLIRKLTDKSTFIVSSHNLDEIENVCGQIILIDKGKLVKHCAISELIEQDNCLTLLLNQSVSDQIKAELEQFPEIQKTELEPENPKRLSIYFKSDKPDTLQIKIMEIFQKHGIGVIEFSRGAALTDKVVGLVKNTESRSQNPGT